ncbi:MAG: response regulator [Candidatus Rokubacteria bacterium]|nr:response regulator [Candidatus Rokubacteria bacterium]
MTERRTVLIVDDEPEVRAVLAEYLRDDGFEVLEAGNGLEALLAVKRHRLHGIVLDLRMPRLGGLEALRRIRAFDPGIGVVVVTGVQDVELHRQALVLGARAVFTKPVVAADLAAALGGRVAPPAPAPPPAPAAEPPEARPAKGRVLIVDDEPTIGEILEEFLRGEGWETRRAADGREGVRAVLDWKPDVVLLDIEMPGLSGVGALPAIFALAPDTKVIMVSGTRDEELSRSAFAHGAFDYVTKPVDFPYLAQAIETALTMKRLDEA